MRRREPARVLGPYLEGETWRIIHVDGTGHRTSHRLSSEKEALQLKRKLAKTIAAEPQLTLGDLIDRYLRYLHEVRAVRAVTLQNMQSSLNRFFEEALARSPSFTQEAAEAWYRTHTQKAARCGNKILSVATHQMDLKTARRLYRWADKKGLVCENPWQGIEPIGRARVGKQQWRINEARRFIDGTFADLQSGDTDALAPLLALLMGLRASEVMRRNSRDVDDRGRLLWIDSGKTAHSRRHLRVPAILAEPLAQLAAQRQDEPFLFGTTRNGQAPTQRLAGIMRRLCRRHEVPNVCPHSLRGLYATLAMEQGAVSDMVAASLGHTSFTTTARHYAQPQAVRHAKTERVLAVLDPQTIHGHDKTTEQTLRVEPPPAVLSTETQEGVSAHVVAEFITPTYLAPRPLSAPMASVASQRMPLDLVAVPGGESPLITWLSSLSRRKHTRVFGPYKNGQGYRLVVLEGGQRKSIVLPSLEQAEALRTQIVTVINRSQNLPTPDKA